MNLTDPRFKSTLWKNPMNDGNAHKFLNTSKLVSADSAKLESADHMWLQASITTCNAHLAVSFQLCKIITNK